jgi:hypothetical protein
VSDVLWFLVALLGAGVFIFVNGYISLRIWRFRRNAYEQQGAVYPTRATVLRRLPVDALLLLLALLPLVAYYVWRGEASLWRLIYLGALAIAAVGTLWTFLTTRRRN